MAQGGGVMRKLLMNTINRDSSGRVFLWWRPGHGWRVQSLPARHKDIYKLVEVA